MKFRVSFMVDFLQDSGCTENICAALITNISKEILIRESLEMGNLNSHSTPGSVSLLITVVDKLILWLRTNNQWISSLNSSFTQSILWTVIRVQLNCILFLLISMKSTTKRKDWEKLQWRNIMRTTLQLGGKTSSCPKKSKMASNGAGEKEFSKRPFTKWNLWESEPRSHSKLSRIDKQSTSS